LKTFIAEADLPVDTGSSSGSITIESILQEKKEFDLSLNFEKLGVDDKALAWTVPAPSKPTILQSLPSRSNILSVAVFDLSLHIAEQVRQYIAVTTADRRLHLLNPASSTLDLVHSYTSFQDSPILDIAAVGTQYLLIASMSGKLLVYDTRRDQILDERKDHSKYLVKLATWTNGTSTMVASAGWDAKVFLYRFDVGDSPQLGEPIATLALTSIPETLLFVKSPEDGTPILLVARRDSTYMYYYSVPGPHSQDMTLLGKQNLAPHSNAWVAFTPADIQICPTDPALVAIATSTTPHMKLLIVKLLLPPTQPTTLDTANGLDSDGPLTVTQASQARAELLVSDREEAAILINVSTLAPQTAYSTPRLSWRPDGSGVYVSSDDGIVRGLEVSSGKPIALLEAHDAGSKLRCFWTGRLRAEQDSASPSSGREVLISGGFDQKLILWNP
jgi:WD40 repeat protein